MDMKYVVEILLVSLSLLMATSCTEDLVIDVEVPEEALIARLTGRRICKN